MSLSATVKVSKRYQIAVPVEARQQLNIQSGDIQDGMLILMPEPEGYSKHLAGLHKEIWQGINVQQYING